jgi:hypothetical protein
MLFCFFQAIHVPSLHRKVPNVFDDKHADELQGQSTAQTTGIAGHLSGRFIPTVERGSIDLT